MSIQIRPFEEQDYFECQELVNQAWQFDALFQPAAFSQVAQEIYTRGSLLESNFCRVAVTEQQVIGFLFGFNEKRPVAKNLWNKLKLMWRLIRVKADTKTGKKRFTNALIQHQKNRYAIAPEKISEIVLFVIHAAYRQQGLGQRLWGTFLDDCRSSRVATVQVETNLSAAAPFYAKLGFEHSANFDSPLHALATPNGQACLYRYEVQ